MPAKRLELRMTSRLPARRITTRPCPAIRCQIDYRCAKSQPTTNVPRKVKHTRLSTRPCPTACDAVNWPGA
eukprot:1145673-Rhodomonas_salina.2